MFKHDVVNAKTLLLYTRQSTKSDFVCYYFSSVRSSLSLQVEFGITDSRKICCIPLVMLPCCAAKIILPAVFQVSLHKFT